MNLYCVKYNIIQQNVIPNKNFCSQNSVINVYYYSKIRIHKDKRRQ